MCSLNNSPSIFLFHLWINSSVPSQLFGIGGGALHRRSLGVPFVLIRRTGNKYEMLGIYYRWVSITLAWDFDWLTKHTGYKWHPAGILSRMATHPHPHPPAFRGSLIRMGGESRRPSLWTILHSTRERDWEVKEVLSAVWRQTRTPCSTLYVVYYYQSFQLHNFWQY